MKHWFYLSKAAACNGPNSNKAVCGITTWVTDSGTNALTAMSGKDSQGNPVSGGSQFFAFGMTALEASGAGKLLSNGLKAGQSFGKLGIVQETKAGVFGGFVSNVTKNPYHGLDQAITRGVSPQVISQTVSKPLVVLKQAGDNILYLTREAVVVLDKESKLVTTYPSKLFESHVTEIINLLK